LRNLNSFSFRNLGSDVPDGSDEDIQAEEDDYDPGDDDAEDRMVQEYKTLSAQLIDEDIAHVRALFHNAAAYFYDEAAQQFYIRLPIGK